jgi:hypothetical protein
MNTSWNGSDGEPSLACAAILDWGHSMQPSNRYSVAVNQYSVQSSCYSIPSSRVYIVSVRNNLDKSHHCMHCTELHKAVWYVCCFDRGTEGDQP